MTSPTTPHWTTTPGQPDDVSKLGRFVKGIYEGRGAYGSIDLYQWKVIDNYIRPGIINLVKDGAKIISTLSMAPRQLFIRQAPAGAAEVVDAYTDPNYQRQGLFALLLNDNRAQAEQLGMHFIYATPNPLSLSGFQKKGHFAQVDGVDLRSLALPLNLRPVTRRLPWLFAAAFDWVCSTAVFLGLALTRPFRIGSSDVTIESCDGRVSPEWRTEWNTFWQAAMKDFDFIFARDWDAIHWRYFQNPNAYTLLVARQGPRVVGYLVYRLRMDPDGSHLLVADYLALPGQEAVIGRCLQRALGDGFRSGVSVLSTWCPAASPYFRVFKRFGFLNRKVQPFLCYPNETSLANLRQCRTWHFTTGDSDNV